MSSVAARLILEARKRAGLSQAELARRAGVPHSVLSAYEHGRRDPGTAMLARLLTTAGYRLSLAGALPEAERSGRLLAQVLDLADRLPRKRRSRLRYPGLPRPA